MAAKVNTSHKKAQKARTALTLIHSAKINPCAFCAFLWLLPGGDFEFELLFLADDIEGERGGLGSWQLERTPQ